MAATSGAVKLVAMNTAAGMHARKIDDVEIETWLSLLVVMLFVEATFSTRAGWLSNIAAHLENKFRHERLARREVKKKRFHAP